MDWNTILPAALTGAIAGVVASLLAPWVQWAIEKRRSQQKGRLALLRSNVPSALYSSRTKEEFSQTPAYSRLRPYLKQSAIDQIEADDAYSEDPNPYSSPDDYRVAIQHEISRLEHEWKLI